MSANLESDTPNPSFDGEDWVCACGETDPMKHDLGMVIAHLYELPEQQGRDILVRIRDRAGLDTDDEDRVVAERGETDRD